MINNTAYYWRTIPLVLLIFHWSSNLLLAQETPPPLPTTSYAEQERKMEDLFAAGDFSEAYVVSQTLLQIAEVTEGTKSEAYGNSLDYIGIIAHHIGQLEEAHTYLEAGVAHAKQYHSDKPELEATRLSNFGMLLKDMGELGQAIHRVQRAYDLGRKVWPHNSPEYGTVVHNLSLLYSAFGQYAKAETYAYESLSATEKAVGKQHIKYAFRLANIANILDNTQKSHEALTIYPEILEVLRATDNEKHLLYAITLRNIGRAYSSLKDYESALPYLTTARDSILNRYGDTHPQYIRVLSNLGWVQAQLGAFPAAEQSLTTAYQLYQTHGKLDNSNRILLVSRLSNFYESQNNLVDASAYYMVLAEEISRILQYELPQFSEQGQRSWAKRLSNSRNNLLSFTYRHPELSAVKEAAINLSLLFRQMIFENRRVLLAQVEQSTDTLLLNTLTDWKTAQKNLGKVMSLPKLQQPEDLATQREQVYLLERKLTALSYNFKLLQTQPIGWHDLQHGLLPSTRAVDIFAFKYVHTNMVLSDSVYYAAWVISPNNPSPEFVPLFAEHEAGNLRRTRQLYAVNDQSGAISWQQLLFAPLKPYLREANTLYYTTDGVLQLVNIGAIPIDEHDTMADRFTLYRVNHLRQLLDKRPPNVVANNALVYGGLRYDPATATDITEENQPLNSRNNTSLEVDSYRNWSGQNWDYLNWSNIEANEIANRLTDKQWQVEIQTQYQGTETAFKTASTKTPSPRLIHLATHAFYFPKPENNSSSIGFKIAQDPLLRAGLILAGGNAAWQGELISTEAEDGILTAYEISQLKLEQTELVVLSACNTGRGEIVGSEGVFGLQRAFKAAGVKYILMSLWSVDDKKTYEFMQHFYTAWQTKGQDIPTAYQTAQSTMRSQYATPFNPAAWAGFILVE